MLIPEVKNYYSPDVPNLEAFFPEDEPRFSFLLSLTIGVKGEDWGEQFDLVVCTPEWLRQNNSEDAVLFLKGYLIVFSYNLKLILTRIDKVLQHCQGETWKEVAQKISRFAQWEFEDYRPFVK